VRLSSPAPPDPSEYQRLFQAPIRFNQTVSGLVLERSTLDLVHPQADPALSEVLDDHAQQMLIGPGREAPFISEVRRILKESLYRGDLDLDSVARKLALSRRGLQRMLIGYGTSYRELIDDVRRESTIRLLEDSRPDIAEIAFLMRFSEPSAFHRAFKRWTGKTPREYLKSRT